MSLVINPLSRNVPYFFFTCLTPEDFTRQWGSSAAQWVKLTAIFINPLHLIGPYFILLSNAS
jgi:hypothetical protein